MSEREAIAIAILNYRVKHGVVQGLLSSNDTYLLADKILAALAAARPDREGDPLRTAVETVLSTFKKDLEQGYRTRDKEFAIDILSMGLKLSDEQEVP